MNPSRKEASKLERKSADAGFFPKALLATSVVEMQFPVNSNNSKCCKGQSISQMIYANKKSGLIVDRALVKPCKKICQKAPSSAGNNKPAIPWTCTG